jgi:rhodanese-related sulfurtransferase
MLDVREADEFATGRIPGAINLPRGLLELNIAKVTSGPQTMIVCNCGGGGRSALAARTLHEMGYQNVVSLAGGFKAWVGKGLPVQR